MRFLQNRAWTSTGHTQKSDWTSPANGQLCFGVIFSGVKPIYNITELASDIFMSSQVGWVHYISADG